MAPALRRTLVGLALVALLLTGGGVAVARGAPELGATTPTSVTGTEATGVFRIGDRTVRQVRYDDGGVLAYTFRLTNEDRLPVSVLGLAADQPDPRLFAYAALTGRDDDGVIRLAPGGTVPVTLSLLMGGCETLSSRAGSFVTEVVVRTEQAGIFDDEVTITLPEELHTGSPREAFCPDSTTTSRPPG